MPIPIRVTFIRVLILTTVLGVGGSLVLRATHGFKPPSSSLGSFVKFELRRTQIMLSTHHMDLGTRFHDENSINLNPCGVPLNNPVRVNGDAN